MIAIGNGEECPFCKKDDKFIKYGVDSLQLTQSESYYSKIPKIYLKIYNNVEKRLKKTKDSLNKINLSN